MTRTESGTSLGRLPIRLLYTLVFASGMTALNYQVVWMRMLSDALGVTVLAVVSVLSVFMGGLALGSYVFGRLVDRSDNPIRIYALLEIGIGISAVLLLPLLSSLTTLFDHLQREYAFGFTARMTARVLYSAAVLLIPTFFMGGTFPALCRYLIGRERAGAGRIIGNLYGINTLGAMAGALLAGFFMIETFGIRSSIHITAVGNLVVGLVALGSLPRGTYETGQAAGGSGRSLSYGSTDLPAGVVPIVMAVTLLAGFTSLGYEVFWSKALVFFVGNSTYSVSITLASFLFGISLGSLIFTKMETRFRNPFASLGFLQIAIGLSASLTVPVLCHLFYDADWLPLYVYFETSAYESVSWVSNLLRIAFTSLLVMIIPTTLMGVAFPLATSICAHAQKNLGRSVGSLYAASTLGSILGSALAGTLIISLLGLQKGILFLSGVNLVLGVWVLFRGRGSKWVGMGILVAGLILLVRFGSALTLPNGFLSEDERGGETIYFYEEGMSGIVKVYGKPSGNRLMSVDGGVIGASSGDLVQKQRILAHLPALLHPAPRSALAVGLGSGITLGSLGLHPELEQIDCVEIVPEVVEGAAHFEQENRGILHDPRVRIIVDDGVNYLRTTNSSYDVISSDAKLNHAFVGNAAVYAKKYYTHCLDRLAPGGIMCQWVPLLLPPEEWKTVARTFLDVFPYASLWFFEPKHAILVGSNQELTIDPEGIAKRLSMEPVHKDLAEFHLASVPAIVASFVTATDGLALLVGEGAINTFDRPVLEFRLPRAFAKQAGSSVEATNLELIFAEAGDVRPFLSAGDPVDRQLRHELAASLLANEEYWKGLIETTRQNQAVAGSIHFRRAAEIAPADPRVNLYLQRIRDEAEGLRAHLSTGSEDPVQRFRLGVHLFQGGQYGSAMREFEAAVERNPDYGEALLNLGAAADRLGDIEKAIRSWERAIEVAPQLRQAYLNLASALRNGGDPAAAAELINRCFENTGDHGATYYQSALTKVALGDRDGARSDAERALVLAPGNTRFQALVDELDGP